MNNIEMQVSIEQLISLTIKQVQNNFFILSKEEIEIMNKAINIAINRYIECFEECKVTRYKKNGVVCFDPTHSGQYLTYLYYLSNTLFEEFNNSKLASYVYYLNKIFNSIDIFYEVKLPRQVFFEHPVGTVIGRGKYKDGLIIYQNCTIGQNKGKYPSIGRYVTLLTYACIVGKCEIGDNCVISSHTYIKDEKIPSNSLVFGQSPNLIIKEVKDKIVDIFK